MIMPFASAPRARAMRDGIRSLAWACLAAAAPAIAQDFPARPVRIVTAAVGGSADLVARLIAQGLPPGLGQQVIVENRPGGGGIVTLQYVARGQSGHRVGGCPCLARDADDRN